ncbi:hypothetical protein C8Q72DRAFT_825055, partial [Fomitopsis betulina]
EVRFTSTVAALRVVTHLVRSVIADGDECDIACFSWGSKHVGMERVAATERRVISAHVQTTLGLYSTARPKEHALRVISPLRLSPDA